MQMTIMKKKMGEQYYLLKSKSGFCIMLFMHDPTVSKMETVEQLQKMQQFSV